MTFPILGGNGAGAEQYLIDNSIRLNSSDSAFLKRTNSTAGNRQKWTFSTWVKRTLKVDNSVLIYPHGASNNLVNLAFGSGTIFMDIGSVGRMFQTNAVFRDVSAWYHIVVAFNTTDYSTVSAGQVRVYVNGVEQTFSTTTNMSVGFNSAMNDAVDVGIGRDEGADNNYADHYLAETHLIDGQQLSPTDFGEFDEDSGIWKPISYTGTYGTNGFYLDFENSGSLGADQSGNGNNFTPTNLASNDQTTDTPTNNFATLNSTWRDNISVGTMTYSNGNTTYQPTTNGNSYTRSTFGMSNKGKWYAEMKVTEVNTGQSASLTITPDTNFGASTNSGYGFQVQLNASNTVLNKIVGGTTSSINNSFASGSIAMLAVDLDNGKMWVGYNGTWYNNNNASSTLDVNNPDGTGINTSYNYIYGFQAYWQTPGYYDIADINFGNPSFSISSGNSDDNGYGNFEYAPPTGFLSLCTQNLATVSPPTIDDGSQYFNTVLYTGNGSTNVITGVGFQPDFVWTKLRSQAGSHSLADVIRGGTAVLRSDLTVAEVTRANHIQSFDSDGFTLAADGTSNLNTSTNVAWNWKANGSGVSNTDGSITSTVSVNPTAGFSIVTYTGTGSVATVGHGLGVKPKVVILKNRSSATDWLYLTDVIDGSNDLLNLNQTGAKSDSGLAFTSTTFATGSGGGSGGSGSNYVAYCFAEIEGYSKFGKYTGNGSTDGTFAYTGFRPAWVLYKKSSATENWHILDNKRDTLNPNSFGIDPNTTGAEANDANLQMDFLSNGFKLRTSHGTANGSGETYIYMAFAESPFVSSGAVPVTAR
jgi:hypothetical protein